MNKVLPFLALLLLYWSSSMGGSRLQLRNIAFKEGLNNMNISSIAQDHQGYIWVATMGGVSRYNGYEFKRFYFDSSDPSSLRSNHVASLFCSSEGIMYIGTVKGMNCFDSKSGKLTPVFPDFNYNVYAFAEWEGYIYMATANGLFRFQPGSEKLEGLGRNLSITPVVSSLVFDKSGNLWCGLDNGFGLALYDRRTDQMTVYRKTEGESLINYNSGRTLFMVGEDAILVGTKSGIALFDCKSKRFIASAEFAKLLSGLSGYDIRFILEKQPSVYWIGTLQSGLFIYDKSRNTLIRHTQNDGSSEIHSNNYMCCHTDRSGNVWLGTFDAGLEVSFKQAKNFNFDISLNKLTQGKFITAIAKDQKQNLVVTTRENGFYCYDMETKSSQIFNISNSKLGHSNLRTIFVDSENKYWIGIYFGLQIFDPKRNTFKTLSLPEPNNGAVTILEVNKRIYVGTDGKGLLVFDLEGKLLSQHTGNGVNIPKIIRLNENELLFLSYGIGLFTMNIHDDSIKRIDLADVQRYPGLLFAVTALKDKAGKIWIGTYNYGLYVFDFENLTVKNYNIREGLPSSDVIGIEEDEANNLWLSTSYGLARLNLDTQTIKTYFFNEGVNNYQFHGKAAYKDGDGLIYFGGNSGLTYFNPAEIVTDHSEAPRVVFENLYIQNQLVTPIEKGGVLNESLAHTRQITFTHRDQPFSIDFVSFDYLSPEKIKYAYFLEGFDREWNNIGAQRRVSYSNLPRGNYSLKVRSVNGAGVGSENEAELIIIVKPAPWLSYTAWVFYILIVAGIAFFIFRLRIKALVYKHNLENEHYEHLREREINGMKQKFFTNISHELRTPLTLVYGLVTQLSRQENLTPQVKDYAQSLDLNVGRLLKLINQLLTFKTIESETLTLWLEKGKVNEEIRKILELFTLYAKEKEIRIDFFEDDCFTMYFDHDKLEKILSNLLSNAIKHSEKGGRIEVGIRKISMQQVFSLYGAKPGVPTTENIEISVSDTGSGIDEKEWSTIFDRYKQVDSAGRRRPDYSGTGIGLNFTKMLVESHKGMIRMESKKEEGSTFAFILPMDCSIFEPKDFAESGIDGRIPDNSADRAYCIGDDQSSKAAIQCDHEKTIVVVEDDPQLNNFLVTCLRDYYKTVTAHDGETGLKIIKQQHPDIVISDVSMPKMDGYELTRRIKGDKELCHIPIILLTAKSEISSQIEGMQSGADLYVPKPFNVDFLLAAIDSQLKNRKRLHDIFLNGQMPVLDKSEINQLDIQFLSKLNALLERELSNPELDIQSLARNLNMSRSVFYRKFMGLTMLSPNTYIKKHRINKSIELMQMGKYSLIEISEMTGFGSSSYFSTAFRQEKGMSPREFLNQLKERSAPE